MSFFNRFVWIFVSPSRVFADIREERVSWWQPWVWLSIMYVIIGVFSLPIQRVLLELNEQGLTAEQLDQQLRMMDKFGLVQVASTPFVALALGAAVAGITYVLVSIISSQATFKKYFTITLYSGLVAGAAQIISVAIVRARGLDTIRSADDAMVSVGLRFLAPENNTVLKALFSSFEFFSLWSLFLIGMGLVHVFGMSRGQAILCVIPWWIIFFAMTLVGQIFGGMA